MKLGKSLIVIVSLLAFSSCNAKNTDTTILLLEPTTIYQTIDNFGASDCWSCQYIGKNWDLAKREQIAEWLFSKELDKNGQPKGIGLSAWRFNIGAGSAEQGDASDIPQVWRRAECFIDANGQYDWTKQKGQQWFLQKAKSYGIDNFLAFAISPPVSMTIDGKAHGSGRKTFNLQEDKYDDFSRFLSQVMLHFKDKKGISFNYISPENEPQWDWGESISQEGTACTNEEYARIVKNLNQEFTQINIATKIQLSECAQIDYLYSDSTNRPLRDNQLEDFFATQSSNYIGDLSTVSSIVTGHSYFTTWPVDQMIKKRESLKEKLNEFKHLNYWQSEYCVLENNEEIKGHGRDLGMNTALYVARLMHYDLAVANASSWQWWLAVSPHDYKDGLVYTDNDTLNGEIYDSKLLWAFGNYCRFIRPGMQRIGLSLSPDTPLDQQANGIMASAYKSDDKTVIVAINYSKKQKNIKISNHKSGWTPYITSKERTNNLKPLETVKNSFILPPRSVVTFVNQQ